MLVDYHVIIDKAKLTNSSNAIFSAPTTQIAPIKQTNTKNPCFWRTLMQGALNFSQNATSQNKHQCTNFKVNIILISECVELVQLCNHAERGGRRRDCE